MQPWSFSWFKTPKNSHLKKPNFRYDKFSDALDDPGFDGKTILLLLELEKLKKSKMKIYNV